MRRELEQYQSMVRFLSETLGSTFEAGLFDLTDPAYPSVVTANVGSDVQEHVRQTVAEGLTHPAVCAGGNLINRPIHMEFEKLLKVSVFYIRDHEGEIIGALWISMRCDMFLKMSAFAASFLQLETEDPQDQEVTKNASSSKELSLDTINEFIREFSNAPARMTLDERQEAICDLYDMGVYNLKGAVARTAEIMQISEQSVYRYIAKLKKARDW